MKKATFFVTAILIFLIFGCKDSDSDPCEDTTCLNWGICENGLCDCPEWYGGENCEYLLAANKMIISLITITSFSDHNNTTTNWWDPTGNEITRRPDMYFALTDDLGNTSISTGYVDCVYENDNYYKYSVNWELDYDKTYTLRLLDDDNLGVNGDDQMGIREFIPSQYDPYGSRPHLVHMDLYYPGDNDVIFDVSWER